MAAPSSSSKNDSASASTSGIFNEAHSLISRGGLGSASLNAQHLPRPSPAIQPQELNAALDNYEAQFLPHGPKSLSGIALRSFLLGLALSSTLLLTTSLLFSTGTPLWRAPFFLAALSAFHFLEFYTTSYANTSAAQISSFLFSSNGSAYTVAHTASLLETLLAHTFLPGPLLPRWAHYGALCAGLVCLLVGQAVRAIAMLHAGPNFSHVVRHTKSTSHELVTTGIYAYFRHPSYFGFFWWGIGTQLVCGNTVCLVAYTVVLWKFFSSRISGEEELLVGFFGAEYVGYKARTRVGIPFIK
ncbi:hypothetical protein LZ554_007734 [Drepanopeziza brunnea f. sp. 'monogermtubi']|nr:hypothetical protein LZ554_007734 [Drepanopeziza brunnea f. sp. 'monogermtubi']